jgi:hypothetical protein
MRNAIDNRLHFSELKEFSRSPAHYRYACEHPRSISREMTVGAVFDALVLGGRTVALYPGKVRNGREWNAYQADHLHDVICIESEHREAMSMAKSVQRDQVAMSLLEGGEKQRVLQWDWCGVPCAAGLSGKRGGLDVLHEDDIVDLKATHTANPDEWMRHAWRQHYHSQLSFYRTGAAAIGRIIKRAFLIGVESSPPHCVTCLEFSEGDLDAGEKQCRLWIEKYKACEEANAWPGYMQSVVSFQRPAWAEEEEA